MAAALSDSLSSGRDEDVARIRSRGRYLRYLCFAAGALVLLFVIIPGLSPSSELQGSLNRSRQQLFSQGSEWASNFADSQLWYREWLENHGTKTELRLFDHLSEFLLRSAAHSVGRVAANEDRGVFHRSYLSALSASMRIGFMIIGCARLWVVVLLGALTMTALRVRVYKGADLLGQLGNGRLFYSGIRGELRDLSERGAPNIQVIGLACPASVPSAVARRSELASMLTQAGAMNATNLNLVAMILRHQNWPAAVAPREEVALLDRYEVLALPQHTARLLERVLDVHSRLRASPTSFSRVRRSAAKNLPEKITSAGYFDQLSEILALVLTPKMREQVAAIAPAHIATIVLALEAGKIMAFASDAGFWWKKSQFPHLCARAILHSLSSYSEDYGLEEREVIRRAIIFGSRKSAFAPVRMPRDLTPSIRSLRQWVEVLLSAPYELEATADEVEFYGIVSETQQSWYEHFINSVMSKRREVSEVYATQTNLFFLSVPQVLGLVEEVLPREAIARLGELALSMYQRQQLERLEINDSEDTATPSQLFGRIAPPITDEQARAMAQLHGVDVGTIHRWAAARFIFTTFGWLARRVGDDSVPQSAMVLTAFGCEERLPGANERGLLGKRAMVPFRASRLAEKWGRGWASRFTLVNTVTIADSAERYEKILSGVREERRESEETGVGVG